MRCIHICGIAIVSCYTSYAYVDPEGIKTVDAVYPGQNYGDTIYFSVIKPKVGRGQYYELIGEDKFISALGADKYFLFKWYPKMTDSQWRSQAVILNTDNEGNQFKTTGADVNDTVKIIEDAGLSIYTCSGNQSKILSLFSQSVINSGFVLGVVDSNLKYVYDLSERVSWYSTQGSLRSWDGVTYETTWTNGLSSSYEILDDRGNKALAEDIAYGIKWIKERRTVVDDSQPVIERTNVVERTEQVVVQNVEYYYVTNKTVIVNPDFKGLDSVLDLTYPKFSTEGTNGVYILKRSGLCADALTVHVLTNGYFCANVSWAAGESGSKRVRIWYGVDYEFNDNRPFEVLVKSLNRKVGTRISEE